jgi:glycosyltransferase involved in cell wall biosynthesis
MTEDCKAANSADQRIELFDVVSFGARDYYEVGLALNEVGMLHRLYTDWYTPDFARRWIGVRFNEELSSKKTRSLWIFAALALAWRRIPPSWFAARAAYRVLDYAFGFYCGAACYFTGPNRAIVYSYYLEGFLAFYRATNKKPEALICFQVHPAPAYVQRKLREDAEAYGASQSVTFMPDTEEDLSEAAQQSYARALAACQSVICASSVSRESISDISGAARIDIVPYGSRFGQNVVLEPVSLSATGPIRLLSVCQLTQRKGMHWAFRAMSELPLELQKRFDWRIVAAKRDPAIAAMAPANVTITDWLSQAELADEFKKADLFIMPSVIEGFGLVYLESLSFGTPVLYTDRTGAADFCLNGVHGFKVPVSDWRELLEVLRRCAGEPDLLSVMRRECHSLERDYTWERFRVGIRSACRPSAGHGLRAPPAASPLSEYPGANGIDRNHVVQDTQVTSEPSAIGRLRTTYDR